MTYRSLYHLKYEKGLSTPELARRFPHDLQRVSEVALLDLSDETLQRVVQEKSTLKRVKALKKKFGKDRHD